MKPQENKLLTKKNVLLCVDSKIEKPGLEEIKYLKDNFCGKVVTDIKGLSLINYDCLVYVMGNIKEVLSDVEKKDGKTFYVVKELSSNYEGFNVVGIGEVPLNVHNVGIFFREFFNSGKNYFHELNKEHQFQLLTESNKPGRSYRKGIYLSHVEEKDDSVNFHLLRCSTNFDGPTDNFRQTDHEILDKVNHICHQFYQQKADLNHVLAQVYNNTKVDGKEHKAKIKVHSDKTKDMPSNGLMAFCTFYQFNDEMKDVKKHKDDPYDYYYKDASVLTRLRFRLKNCVTDPTLVKNFDVVLYPNSVFVISLETNRLYTHEIVPSHLPIDKLPTRLGYVIRCSDTRAVFNTKDNQTYIEGFKNKLIKLEEPTPETTKALKDTYFKENTSDEVIDYGEVNFSLNKGDYIKPLV